MDLITIKDMRFLVCHGVNPPEKITPQRFAVSVEAWLDLPENDEVTDTVNWSDIRKLVSAVMEGETCNLVETLAQRIAEAILRIELIHRVRVTVQKPDAWSNKNGVPGIVIERCR